jgi:type IV fimbrial biogenesis protein FimT
MAPRRIARMPRRAGGLTLLELLVVCALAGIVLGLAAPGFDRMMLDARRTSQVNAFVRALHLARSTAIRRAVPVAICASVTGSSCLARARDWSAGYIVFANLDRDSPAQVDAGEPVLHVQRVERITVSANRDALVYWPVSMAGTTATVSFCDARGSSAARAVIISHTGRPRVAARDASGRPIRCP